MKNLIIGKMVGVILWTGLLTAFAQGGVSLGGSGGMAVPGNPAITYAQAQSQPYVIDWENYGAAKKPKKEVGWLGLFINESSAAVASQLGLKQGEGLTVVFVAPDSPAARTDFRTNDVLVELDGQMLVHPMQFRKLIQVRSEGDTVKLTYFRAGEKQTASVKLGKTKIDEDAGNGNDFGGRMRTYQEATQNFTYLFDSDGRSAGVVGGAASQQNGDKEVTWLGVGTGESSGDEALSAQLSLQPGEGLTVNYLTPDSPAAQAGLQTNDVLTALDDQMLVHPLQLRKLVEMHADGDSVIVAFCRAKKQMATVKLGKTSAEKVADAESGFPGDIPNPSQLRLQGLPGSQQANASQSLVKDLARMADRKAKAQLDLGAAMDQARKTIQNASRQLGTNEKGLAALNQQLEALNLKSIDISDDAKLVVSRKSGTGNTIVQTDEEGTLIIEAGAKKHLTARDKNGKTLFDGDVDTTDEQAKVPAAVWEKAKPLLNQLTSPAAK